MYLKIIQSVHASKKQSSKIMSYFGNQIVQQCTQDHTNSTHVDFVSICRHVIILLAERIQSNITIAKCFVKRSSVPVLIPLYNIFKIIFLAMVSSFTVNCPIIFILLLSLYILESELRYSISCLLWGSSIKIVKNYYSLKMKFSIFSKSCVVT